jgi:hypothetical protein
MPTCKGSDVQVHSPFALIFPFHIRILLAYTDILNLCLGRKRTHIRRKRRSLKGFQKIVIQPQRGDDKSRHPNGLGRLLTHDDRTKANEKLCVTTTVLKITSIIRSDDEVLPTLTVKASVNSRSSRRCSYQWSLFPPL